MNSMAMETLLGGILVALAIRLLWTSNLFEGIVLFIVFGLVLTLVWAWLGAADVALAEAAIGAGLTGALLLAAWRNAAKRLDSAEKQRATTRLSGSLAAAAVGAAVGVVLQISLGDRVEGEIQREPRLETRGAVLLGVKALGREKRALVAQEQPSEIYRRGIKPGPDVAQHLLR